MGSAATVASEFYVGTGTTDSLFASINSAGISSVGVNTSSPAYVLDVHGPVSTGQTALFVHGDTYITGTLNVGTATSEGSDIIIDGDIEIIGISTFEQHVQINNTLDVVGFATFNNVAINTSLYVGGISTFVGVTSFMDNIYVDGDIVFYRRFAW